MIGFLCEMDIKLNFVRHCILRKFEMEVVMKKIGLLVNPIAGMGGRVGLKGTDGKDVLQKAISLGALQEAPEKAKKALSKVIELKDDFIIYTASGLMGEIECKDLNLNYEVIYDVSDDSTANDSKEVLKLFLEKNVDLIFFVGGDGTARDVYSIIEDKISVIGVPAGVKIHSPVYGNTPEQAGDLLAEVIKGIDLPIVEKDVIDIDEDAFRNDKVEVRLYGYLKVPFDQRYLQNKKSPTPQGDHEAQISIACDIVDSMKDDVFYIIGSGTTPMYVMKELNLPNTVLGVDIIKNRKIVKKDCNEQDILDIIKDERAYLVVTPMGGQGYLFGRGNQQLSPNVLRKIRKEDIIIIATSGKLDGISSGHLIAYTMDEDIDKKLRGYYRVKIGYEREKMIFVDNQ